jgi:hypothetical protein
VNGLGVRATHLRHRLRSAMARQALSLLSYRTERGLQKSGSLSPLIFARDPALKLYSNR